MRLKKFWLGLSGIAMIVAGITLLAYLGWSGYIHPLLVQAKAIEEFALPTSTTTLQVPTKTQLSVTAEVLVTTEPVTTSTSTAVPDTPTPEPADFLLEIPVIDLEWVVHEIAELDYDDPWRIPKRELDKFGVVRFPEMAYPDEIGVVALAGHRDISGAPFLKLDKLREGDEIKITLKSGERFIYKVVYFRYVDPLDVSVLEPIEGSLKQLRLVTCLVGSIAQRLIIFAEIPE